MRAKKRRANQSARAEQTTRTARQSDPRLSDARGQAMREARHTTRGQAYYTRPGIRARPGEAMCEAATERCARPRPGLLHVVVH